MKNFIKRVLQKVMGFNTYLFIFSIYIISSLKRNKKEGDFLFFRDMIADESTILDIGANIGAMSVHLARTHPRSEIWAFEPIPYNFRTLKKVVKHYSLKNVKLVETALGNQHGEIEMIMPVEQKARQQGLSHVVDTNINDFNVGEKFITPITSLDRFVAENPLNNALSAIKLDVENFEYPVLLGGCETINKYRPLVYIELWDNENRRQCFDLLRSWNYTVKVLENGSLTDFNPAKHKTQNFFMLP